MAKKKKRPSTKPTAVESTVSTPIAETVPPVVPPIPEAVPATPETGQRWETTETPGVVGTADVVPTPAPEVNEEELEVNLEQFEDLTAHEIQLLQRAIPYAKGIFDATGDFPIGSDLKKFLHCSTESAYRVLAAIKKSTAITLWDRSAQRHERATAKALVESAMGETQYRTTLEYYMRENARLLRLSEKRNLDLQANREYARHLAAEHCGYDELLKNMHDVVQLFGDFKFPVEMVFAATPKVKPIVRDGHTEDAVLLLSDHHHGDVIRREDTSGFPEFDLVIGANRLGYVIRKAKQVLSLHRAMYPIKRLYIWVGGDMGNGVLHDAPNSNALFPPAQVHFAYHMLKFAIDDLLTLTVPDSTGMVILEEIVLLFSVGNHMRIDIHMPHKYQAQRTLDWLIYQMVIEKYSGHPKVSIRAEMSPFIFENIRGHRYMFAHGMQVGYRNRPEDQATSMSKFLNTIRSLFDSPEYRNKTGLVGETFASVCIGDIHVPVEFPRLLSNGSLNGQNELGVNWGLEPIPAGQQLFGVSDNHQRTWKYFLDCSHVQREQNDFNNYGIFAAEYAKRIGRC
jgi:hypothetical protein